MHAWREWGTHSRAILIRRRSDGKGQFLWHGFACVLPSRPKVRSAVFPDMRKFRAAPEFLSRIRAAFRSFISAPQSGQSGVRCRLPAPNAASRTRLVKPVKFQQKAWRCLLRLARRAELAGTISRRVRDCEGAITSIEHTGRGRRSVDGQTVAGRR